MESFEIEIQDILRSQIYNLKGKFKPLDDGRAYSFKINTRNSSFRGFGGSIDTPLPEIAVMAISTLFQGQILDKINKMVDYEKEASKCEDQLVK